MPAALLADRTTQHVADELVAELKQRLEAAGDHAGVAGAEHNEAIDERATAIAIQSDELVKDRSTPPTMIGRIAVDLVDFLERTVLHRPVVHLVRLRPRPRPRS